MTDTAGTTQHEPVLASVLMLTYNHGPYIRESILSILAQRTPFRFELLVGEDCSTDDTRAIVKELAAAHPGTIRLFASETNLGAHRNGRRIEDAARGKYVAYCEGDDFWHDPSKLAMQVAFLESHPDYVMTHTDYRMLLTDTGRITPSVLGQQDVGDDGDAFSAIIAGRRVIGTLTVCLRRQALDVARASPECYDERFLMGDTQRWLEIARMGKVKYFPVVTATRRALAESATRSKQPERVLRFQRSARDLLEHYIAKYPCSPDAVRSARRRSAMAVLRCAYAAGDQEEARRTRQALASLGEGVPWLARFYQFGSGSAARKNLVAPMIWCSQRAESVARRLRRWRTRA